VPSARDSRRPVSLRFLAFLLVLLWLPEPVALAQAQTPTAAPTLSDPEIERFLLEGRITKTKSIGKGVTNSVRATLTEGTITHDAQIQVVDERKNTGPSSQGPELNFRDTWAFNIAAYKLDRLIGLNLVPVSVERRYQNKVGAFTWWIDDVMMDEGERLKKNIQPPSPSLWNETMQLVRIFDQLIYNMDRNMGNLLITKDWRIWAIDHTRAFRLHKTLKNPANVTRCDRGVFEGLKRLDKPTLERELGRHLTNWEMDAVLARRDAIVKIIEAAGPDALFERRQK
jgi:hypothetical protein